MTTDQLDRAVREALKDWHPEGPSGPVGVADRVMRRRRRRNAARALGTALGLAGICVGTVFANGPGGGEARPAGPPSQKSKLAWRATLPGKAWDACTLGSGAVYCQGPRYDAVGVDARTGKVEWTRKSKGDATGASPAAVLPGVRDGVLYTFAEHAPRTSDTGTDLVALDTGSHRELWRHEMADSHRDRIAAMLFGDKVLANSPSFRSVKALDAKSGKELWQHRWKNADCDRAVIAGVPYLPCSPAGKGAAKESSLVRLDPDTGRPQTVATVRANTAYLGTDGDAVLLAAPGGGRESFTKKDMSGKGSIDLVRVDTSSGKVSRHPVKGFPGYVVADGVILAQGNSSVSAYRAADGKRLWTRQHGLELRMEAAPAGSPKMSELVSPPVVDLEHRVAYLMSPAGQLVGLDLGSGAVRWKATVDLGEVPIQEGVAPELMFDGSHLVGQSGDQLFRIKPVLPGAGS
ncbi:PQQ-binding-like beta-propeller repeat protein [Streptomyces sp. A7024]|uniref:PQQ-binding-like beta-propeller repeat protein n=1 Tax=Streptomyces coryli TaxID=1128680 RepID=A0A6G4U281_9ACTN|nr:PQQ-binding-like beta-propeller repeat protein [Streptomyces coryli]NGN65478.1 PQQ-binding-like beta-propeller repeat protein [Streptomyces coryli]